MQRTIPAPTRIEHHLRGAAEQPTATKERGLVSWSYTIAEELEKYGAQPPRSTPGLIRGIFSEALLQVDSKVAHSPLLWSWWFDFECSVSLRPNQWQKTQAEGKAREVFLNGLRYFPGLKSWVLRGVKHFAEHGGMADIELKQVCNILSERELRVRTEVAL